MAEPSFHLEVLDELTFDAEIDGAVPLASLPDNRYPYVYPRDVASITRAWLAAIETGVQPEACRDHIVAAARFFAAVQSDGWWYQRYALDGTDTSIYVQEDNVAHGIRVLSHAIQAMAECGDLSGRSAGGPLDEPFLETLVDRIGAAVAVLRDECYDANAHLLESTSSIHEGRIESGYTLWVNCAALAASRRAADALDRLESDTVDLDGVTAVRDRIDSFRTLLEGGVERSFAVEGMPVPRRYSPDGERDERPDITLFAPYYFGLEDLFGEHAARAATRAASSLEDPRLGGIQRFRGFYRDFDVHQHGGNGPWMQYTAWHAQFRFDQAERERGDAVLATVTRHADERGYIPEHLSTRERFEQFVEQEWDTGLDYEKEFDDDVLRDVPQDRIVEELGHMQRAYDEMAAALEEREVISFAEPLAWCHAEFLVALLRRDRGA
ncbi:MULTISPECIES: glucoamylase [Natrialbaceae]|uniref:glucoamylase n=1 Tax=Natrialbaceae TaxID=1644061 RepID=UPI00207CCBF1|nr:glucoamylase [Natronococcus sp. CG52]